MIRIAAAAALAATLLLFKGWIDYRAARAARPKKEPIESWEDDGGALAPHPAGHETSQVPR
ncbi:MAG: hypothetical protein ABI569_03250 [Casimicrobiaceae bacterium]